MRTIEISTDVFAKIWAHRANGEENEDQILRRLLGASAAPASRPHSTETKAGSAKGVVWREDVREALATLGGSGFLREIYAEVKKIRRAAGRTLPVNTDAIIRRELEHNSSDTTTYTGHRDWFTAVDGIGAGRWALREGKQP